MEPNLQKLIKNLELEPIYGEDGKLLYFVTIKNDGVTDEDAEETPIDEEEEDKRIDVFHKETMEYLYSVFPEKEK